MKSGIKATILRCSILSLVGISYEIRDEELFFSSEEDKYRAIDTLTKM